MTSLSISRYTKFMSSSMHIDIKYMSQYTLDCRKMQLSMSCYILRLLPRISMGSVKAFIRSIIRPAFTTSISPFCDCAK